MLIVFADSGTQDLYNVSETLIQLEYTYPKDLSHLLLSYNELSIREIKEMFWIFIDIFNIKNLFHNILINVIFISIPVINFDRDCG